MRHDVVQRGTPNVDLKYSDELTTGDAYYFIYLGDSYGPFA
jgi:hypothetical protein